MDRFANRVAVGIDIGKHKTRLKDLTIQAIFAADWLVFHGSLVSQSVIGSLDRAALAIAGVKVQDVL